MNLSKQLPNIVELAVALDPGSTLDDRVVFEVRRLRSTVTLSGREWPLYAVVHEKDRHGRMLTLAVLLNGRQPEWR